MGLLPPLQLGPLLPHLALLSLLPLPRQVGAPGDKNLQLFNQCCESGYEIICSGSGKLLSSIFIYNFGPVDGGFFFTVLLIDYKVFLK